MYFLSGELVVSFFSLFFCSLFYIFTLQYCIGFDLKCVSFRVYSKVIHTHTHTHTYTVMLYIFRFFSRIGYYKILNRNPCVIQ